MNRIIFFENTDRYKKYSIPWSGLKNTKSILGNFYDQELSSFLKEKTIFDDYETIIIHQSLYEQYKQNSLEDKLREYCNTNKKKLVEFTGGISTVNTNNNYLEVPANRMYDNLMDYVKADNPNILILAYGRRWQTNIKLNSLEKINQLKEDLNFLYEFQDELEEEDREYIESKLGKTLKDIPELKDMELDKIDNEIIDQIKLKTLEEINGDINE